MSQANVAYEVIDESKGLYRHTCINELYETGFAFPTREQELSPEISSGVRRHAAVALVLQTLRSGLVKTSTFTILRRKNFQMTWKVRAEYAIVLLAVESDDVQRARVEGVRVSDRHASLRVLTLDI